MEQILICVSLMLMVGGRPSPSNPVSATTDTVRPDEWQQTLAKIAYMTTVTSGPWQYTLWTKRKTYTAQDTLNLMLQIRNVGTTAHLFYVGFQPKWYLTNTSGHVMFSVAPNKYPLSDAEHLWLPPGQRMSIGPFIHALTDSVGNPLTPGSYTFNVDYAGHLLALKLSVQ